MVRDFSCITNFDASPYPTYQQVTQHRACSLYTVVVFYVNTHHIQNSPTNKKLGLQVTAFVLLFALHSHSGVQTPTIKPLNVGVVIGTFQPEEEYELYSLLT